MSAIPPHHIGIRWSESILTQPLAPPQKQNDLHSERTRIHIAGQRGDACVGLVLALVATTTIMSVEDRIKEHAVLQTIGFTGARVFRLVMTESILLSIAGGFINV